MKLKQKAAATILMMSIAGLGAGTAAFANTPGQHGDDPAERAALQAAPVTLSEAIIAAESQTGARAISAELERENGVYAYSVELVSSNGNEQEAYVDTATGNVTLSDPAEDHQSADNDEDDDGDYEDGGDRD